MDWHKLLVVVKSLGDSNVAGGEGAKQGKELAEGRPAEQVKPVHEVNCHNGPVALPTMAFT